ncbi:MAG: hypothetical protein K2W96_26370 [Gemmataceae bacterium]|nr:hypothetical protein [Gemmataceae bacterium]
MDQDTLVGALVEDGCRLAARLVEEGVDVAAACWVRSAEDHRWTLYISTSLIDKKGPLAAYREVQRVLHSLGETGLSVSDIVLIGERHPITIDVLSILRRTNGLSPARSTRPLLGGAPIEEVYVYPKSSRLAHTDLSDEHKRLLVDIYNRGSLAVDDLPYTEEMELIHQAFSKEAGASLTIRDVFKALKNLGRQGRLGGKVRPHGQSEPGPTVAAPATDPTT